MSYINRFVVLALFGLLLALCPAAQAQSVPLLAGAPVGLGIVPYGNTGNGITDAVTWTTGQGAALSTDSYVNNFIGQNAVQGTGFGLPLFDGWGCGLGGFGACGLPSTFASCGPFSTGVGGNWGTQETTASGLSEAASFGLQPIGLAFGVPVVAPGGLAFT